MRMSDWSSDVCSSDLLRIGKAEDVGREGDLRIEPFLLSREFETDLADRIDRGDLIGARAAANIGRVRSGQLLEQVLAAHVGEYLAQFGGEIVPVVEQLRRHAADRLAVDRPPQPNALAIDDIRSEERRAGVGWVRKCRYRRLLSH